MSDGNKIGFFEKWLSLWVVLCMLAGITLGHFAPNITHHLGKIEVAQINLPIAILIWLMITPMLIRVDLKEISHVKAHWRGIAVTLGINWLVKPFSMALLGWIFIRHLFSGWLPAGEADNYIAGLIILAAAPCTAMVFVWSYLCKGDPDFTLSQIALNDVIMIFAFAPIVGLLLGVADIQVPWNTLLYSVMIYIILPFIAAQIVRYNLLKKGMQKLDHILTILHPISVSSLLAMLVLLFGFQGETLITMPLVVILLAVPILIQVYFNSMSAYILNKLVGEKHSVAGPSALIGSSNFFELAVATAISLFGLKSGATLATVVGVLVEVPVMLSVVRIVQTTKDWYGGIKHTSSIVEKRNDSLK